MIKRQREEESSREGEARGPDNSKLTRSGAEDVRSRLAIWASRRCWDGDEGTWPSEPKDDSDTEHCSFSDRLHSEY